MMDNRETKMPPSVVYNANSETFDIDNGVTFITLSKDDALKIADQIQLEDFKHKFKDDRLNYSNRGVF